MQAKACVPESDDDRALTALADDVEEEGTLLRYIQHKLEKEERRRGAKTCVSKEKQRSEADVWPELC